MWGKSLHINLYNCECDEDIFIEPETWNIEERARELLYEFVQELIKNINMKAYGYPTLEWFGEKSAEGYTLIQLIETSNIILHTTKDKSIYLDLFSCKEYEPDIVIELCHKYFKPTKLSFDMLIRQ